MMRGRDIVDVVDDLIVGPKTLEEVEKREEVLLGLSCLSQVHAKQTDSDLVVDRLSRVQRTPSASRGFLASKSFSLLVAPLDTV